MLAALLLALAAETPDLRELLARLAEEAEVFQRMAPQAVAEERLRQKAERPASRFRPRIGKAARQAPPREYQTREIVSEYSLGTLKDSPEALHEFRQVVAVDGRSLLPKEKARERLVLGLRGEDDRARRRMLEEFEQHGLIGAVVDFAPLLLLFAKRRQGDFAFELVGEAAVGADPARVIGYRQVGGAPGVLIFTGNSMLRQPLQGRIFVRKSDGLPLRITASVEREVDGQFWRDEATVEYAMSHHAFLAPVSVLHHGWVDGRIVVENAFQYSRFQKFGASTEIKFTEIPEK